MRSFSPLFCAESFSIYFKLSDIRYDTFDGRSVGLMHHSVFNPQLSATCSVLKFMQTFELDLDIRWRKMALSVGVYLLADAEEHFV